MVSFREIVITLSVIVSYNAYMPTCLHLHLETKSSDIYQSLTPQGSTHLFLLHNQWSLAQRTIICISWKSASLLSKATFAIRITYVWSAILLIGGQCFYRTFFSFRILKLSEQVEIEILFVKFTWSPVEHWYSKPKRIGEEKKENKFKMNAWSHHNLKSINEL
jgi:hypothetical protein